MPQVLKDEIRARIVEAAAETFAAVGYERATIAAIAARAGLGGATMYRYFGGKEELFAAVVPDALAVAHGALLAARVRALGAAIATSGSARRRGADGDEAEALLRFWIEHRTAVVILLDRAAGTPHAGYGERFVDELLALTIEAIHAARPGVRVEATTRFVLRRIFESTRGTLASILERHAKEREIRAAIAAFWRYQIAGLRALFDEIVAAR